MNEEEFRSIDRLFHPRAVAVIGPSRRRDWMWLRCFTHGRFQGRVYAVHPKEKTALGLPCFPSILDVPDEVDYVVSAVPAEMTPEIVGECVEKGVKAITIFSSGFSEVGKKELEDEIVRIARGKTRILGPNCMGIYCPESGLTFRPDLSLQNGSVGFVSQSGGNAIRSAMVGEDLGIRFSKIISYGNGCDLDAPELIEYLSKDPKTKIINLYIEGCRDGRRLFKALKEAAEKKPVVVCKGGRTKAGKRAVISHTGALSGESELWEALFKQTKVINVSDWTELSNVTLALLNSPLPRGNRVAIVTISGGSGVMNTDICEEHGLLVRKLSPSTIEILSSKIKGVGTNVKNPLDLAIDYMNPGVLPLVLDSLAKDDEIDSIIFESTFHDMVGPRWALPVVEEMRRRVISFGKKQKETGKPFFIVIPRHLFHSEREKHRRMYLDSRIPTYPTIRRASEVLERLVKRGK